VALDRGRLANAVMKRAAMYDSKGDLVVDPFTGDSSR
jgi:hypothetical protein